MSDHDELPDFSASGDSREEALWQAYQAMLRRRGESRARWSPPEEPSLDLTPERATAPWPPAVHPATPPPAGSHAADAHTDDMQPLGGTGAGRWVVLGSALVLAVGAALAIVLWARRPAAPLGAEPIRGQLATNPPAGAASLPESAPAPIATPAPPPPQLFADASPGPHASPRIRVPLATSPREPAARLVRTRRAPPPGGDSTPAPSGDVSPRRAAALAVRDFYNALAQGDGARAAAVVVPEKRQEGPLSAGELARSYSSLRAPLRVTQIDPINDNEVFVRYHFVTADNHVCLGSAIVDTTRRDGGALVSGVRVFHGC
jgi:hypothetical protein